MSLGEYFQVKRHFIQNGHLPVSAVPRYTRTEHAERNERIGVL